MQMYCATLGCNFLEPVGTSVCSICGEINHTWQRVVKNQKRRRDVSESSKNIRRNIVRANKHLKNILDFITVLCRVRVDDFSFKPTAFRRRTSSFSISNCCYSIGPSVTKALIRRTEWTFGRSQMIPPRQSAFLLQYLSIIHVPPLHPPVVLHSLDLLLACHIRCSTLVSKLTFSPGPFLHSFSQ